MVLAILHRLFNVPKDIILLMLSLSSISEIKNIPFVFSVLIFSHYHTPFFLQFTNIMLLQSPLLEVMLLYIYFSILLKYIPQSTQLFQYCLIYCSIVIIIPMFMWCTLQWAIQILRLYPAVGVENKIYYTWSGCFFGYSGQSLTKYTQWSLLVWTVHK